MTEIEMKIKECTEPISKACEKLTKHLEHHLDNGIEEADANEVGAVADAIKDLADAKEKTIKGLYYAQIMDAMKDSEYGEEYDEMGPKYYRGRSKTTGRYMHRSYMEPMDMNEHDRMSYNGNMNRNYGGENSKPYSEKVHMRDMDRGDSKMYYTEDRYHEGYKRGYEEGSMNSGGGSSRIEMSKKGYEEAKETKDKEMRIQKLNELINSITEEVTPLIREMDVTEKSMLRNGLQALQNKIS